MFLVADNLQITNPVFQEAVVKRDPIPVQTCVKRCVAAGAEAIDINAGPLTKEPEERMTFLVQSVQAVTKLPLYLDTSNATALEAGLATCRNRAVINGISLEPQKLEKILPLAAEYGVDVIGYLLTPTGQVPKTADERLAVATELFEKTDRAGLSPQRVIVDPVVPPLMWEDGIEQAMAFLDTIRTLPDLLGFPVRTIAGLSNLTTGSGPKEKKLRVERTYLAMLAACGLSEILLNIFHEETVRVARTCKILRESKIFTWEAIP
ncbi:MAG: dihydropteroate synthase [Deltaproteobacteria bacterium]|nr:MAG: dihydropteroate synthase [Deltaproteobacteria bacterium]